MDKPDKTIPANLEAEEAVLGSLLIDPDAVIKIASFLKADDFYREKNGWIYQSVLDLHERREPADFVTLVDELERHNRLQEVGGAAYITSLINSVPTAVYVEHYAHIVERTATLRRLIGAAGQIAALAYGETDDVREVVDRAEQLVFDVSERWVRRDLSPIRQIMHNVVDRIDYLHRHKGDLLGVPSGFSQMDKLLGGFQKSDLIVLAARPGVGKCIVSGSRLLDPYTGRLVTIDEIVQSRDGDLLTLDKHYRLGPARPSDFVDDGVKPVFRLRTALGREVITTLSHPFLTIDGWQPLAALATGQRIAVPRALPYFGSKQMPEERVKLLAYLLADGCLTSASPQFTNSNPRLREEFAEAAASFPSVTTRLETSQGSRTPTLYAVGDLDAIRLRRKEFAERLKIALKIRPTSMRQLAYQLGVDPSLICAWQKGDCVPNPETFGRLCTLLEVEPITMAPQGLPAISKNGKNSLTVWLQEMGILGKNAHTKSVPSEIFELTRPQIALFLNRLFACDGSVYLLNGSNPRVSYSTVSLALARDVQHLLLRFGIMAKLRHRQVRYQNSLRPFYELYILGSRSVLQFLDEIGVFGKEKQVEQARRACQALSSNVNLDTVPLEIWQHVTGAKGFLSWRTIYQRLGYPPDSNFHVGQRAPSRDRLLELASILEDPELIDLAQSDLYWDTIRSIEYVGERQVYDLTVEGTHNFVAEDMLVHNTSMALNIAANAAKRYGLRVAFFSLEMSNEQLVQRLLASETGINQQRLRLGDIRDDEWPMLMEAAGVLSDTMLYIDDTPAMSALELRTKARRLQAERGLDLVVVDYLQLMRGDRRGENRVQEISYITRSLKSLARELEAPLLALSQLSRAVESRSDRKPILSDLRESGCLTGDSLVTLAESGARVPIRSLVGRAGFSVWALNERTLKLEVATVSRAFPTGRKQVYRLETRLGRVVRATGNHKFRMLSGWQRLDALRAGDRIAMPRRIAGGTRPALTHAEAALLGHLIGDGCTLPRHAIQYTTGDVELAEAVANLARQVFGDAVQPRIVRERQWYQVYLSASGHLTHGVRNPVSEWLDRMDIFGLRSYEKFVPALIFEQPIQTVAVFLRHLWSTDGCIRPPKGSSRYPAIYYATSSERLARDVQSLFLRFGINSVLKERDQKDKGRTQYHVMVMGHDDILVFADHIGAIDTDKIAALTECRAWLSKRAANTNRDIIPRDFWRQEVVPAMETVGLSTRAMQASIGMAYMGTGLYKQNVSRERMARVAAALGDHELLEALALSDIYWDEIVSIEPDGEEEVYDLTVPGPSNFVANDFIVHNSIEQDADIVMFIYREELVKEDTDRKNIADVIVAKHRNGPTGIVPLYFNQELTKFSDLEMTREPLEYGA